MRPLIFISHSAHEAEADDHLRLLEKGLESAGYDVLLDRTRLTAGNDWRQCLHTWMALCDAAVILVSDSAFSSEWVKKEAAILEWRRTLDPGFCLLPVLSTGVSRDRYFTEGFWPPTGLAAIQAVDRADPAVAVAEVLQTLQSRMETRTSGAYVWNENFLQLNMPKDEISLRRALAALGHGTLPWSENIPLHVKFVRELLHARPDALPNAIEPVAAGLASRIENVIDALLPIWIDGADAAEFYFSCVRSPRIVCLNTADPVTAQSYLLRACARTKWKGLEMVVRGGGDGDLRELIDEIYRGIHSRTSPGRPFTRERIRERTRDADSVPVALILQGDVTEDVLNTLRSEFDAVTFVVLVDPDIAEPCEDLTGHPLFQPPIDAEKERQASRHFDGVSEVLIRNA